MLGGLFDVWNHRVSLIILIFLTEAENEVKDEEELDKIVDGVLPIVQCRPECSIISLGESTLARCKKHEYVKHIFPSTIHSDYKIVEEVRIITRGLHIVILLRLLNILFVNLLLFGDHRVLRFDFFSRKVAIVIFHHIAASKMGRSFAIFEMALLL